MSKGTVKTKMLSVGEFVGICAFLFIIGFMLGIIINFGYVFIESITKNNIVISFMTLGKQIITILKHGGLIGGGIFCSIGIVFMIMFDDKHNKGSDV